MIKPSESGEQQVLAQWLDLNRILWTHVPNGRHRSKIVGALLKREGVKPGVPDVLIFDPPPKLPGGRVGVAIELKLQGGRTSAAQAEWMRELRERGWIARVCHGASAAIEYLTELGYGRIFMLRKDLS